MPVPSAAQLARLACPVCHQALVLDIPELELDIPQSIVRCLGCDRRYPVVDDIPVLIAERSLQKRTT
jgi:uncharacterized protein YbaR (Trm112 family)